MNFDDETMEQVKERFGSNTAALNDYLARRKAAGEPDHPSARSAPVQKREPDVRAARAARAAAERKLTSAVTTQPAKPSAVKLPPKPAALTAQEQETARRKARHDAVMASPQAKGRAAAAAGLLGGAPNMSAEECIAALATMPTDAEAMAKVQRRKADAVWDRAYGVVGSDGPKAAASNPAAKGDDVWSRIYGSNAA